MPAARQTGASAVIGGTSAHPAFAKQIVGRLSSVERRPFSIAELSCGYFSRSLRYFLRVAFCAGRLAVVILRAAFLAVFLAAVLADVARCLAAGLADCRADLLPVF